MWPLIDVERLDETAAAWINAVVDLIIAYRLRSAEQALAYYERLRVAETGQELPHRELYVNLGAPNLTAVRTSLFVTGPVNVKSLIGKGIPRQRAKIQAFTDVAGAASRHVLNGGRQMLVEAVAKDETATHYARVTDANPCAFCAMLASRGAVYRRKETALRTTARAQRGPGHQYHDHCACTVEPAWDRDAPLPERSAEFEKLWADSTGDVSGYSRITTNGKTRTVNNKLKAFRAAYYEKFNRS